MIVVGLVGVGKKEIFTRRFFALAGDRINFCSLQMHLAIAGKLPTCDPMRFHVFLLLANLSISGYVRYPGRSMKSPPFESFPNCARVASFTSRESFMRRRCPSQRNLRRRIACTRSKVRVDALASMCASLPVNLLSKLAFAPLIFASVCLSRSQASHPYVSNEHTAVLYIFSFSLNATAELKIWRSCPMRVAASATLRRTSCMCVPSAANIDPRYLKRNTFFNGFPSHLIVGSCF